MDVSLHLSKPTEFNDPRSELGYKVHNMGDDVSDHASPVGLVGGAQGTWNEGSMGNAFPSISLWI